MALEFASIPELTVTRAAASNAAAARSTSGLGSLTSATGSGLAVNSGKGSTVFCITGFSMGEVISMLGISVFVSIC